jgi:hypothetical protein
LASGSAILFVVCVISARAQAQAQYVPPPTPLPPPVLNPSTPYTVPQPPYTPLAPATTGVAPGSVVTAPAQEALPRTAARSRHHVSSVKSAAKVHAVRHHRRAIATRATLPAYSSYYSDFGYGYGCGWRRAWDGYWFRTSPCS